MAKFKVGDKVTYWVFDKKLNGSVKAVRGESVDIDDGHGGVVTFKAKDLEVWNSRACNAYGWRPATRSNVSVGDYVIDKFTYRRIKDDEEAIDRAQERVTHIENDGFQTPNSGTYELEKFSDYLVYNALRSRNNVVAKALNAYGTARNADAVASQKLRNEWHNAFQSMKRLYDAAKSEGHKAIMDAANAATKVLMDKTQSFGFS